MDAFVCLSRMSLRTGGDQTSLETTETSGGLEVGNQGVTTNVRMHRTRGSWVLAVAVFIMFALLVANIVQMVSLKRELASLRSELSRKLHAIEEIAEDARDHAQWSYSNTCEISDQLSKQEKWNQLQRLWNLP